MAFYSASGAFSHALTVILLILFFPFPAVLAETSDWEVDGTIYRNVRVHEVTPATVTIFHSGGIQQLGMETLPLDLQKRFAYDPEAAAAWRRAQKTERVERMQANLDSEPVPPWPIVQRSLGALPDGGWHRSAVIDPARVTYYKEVDLREVFIEHGLFTKDQGLRSSCAVFAVVSSMEYELTRRAGEKRQLSEEFLIWATRQINPNEPDDIGYSLSDVIRAVWLFGVPLRELQPNTFGTSASSIEPAEAALNDALSRRAVRPVLYSMEEEHKIAQLVHALNNGRAVIVGLAWPKPRILSRTHTLSSEMPADGGNHAVTLIGYRNPTGQPGDTTFIFRNSYGYSWGLAGCGFMQADYAVKNIFVAMSLDVP